MIAGRDDDGVWVMIQIKIQEEQYGDYEEGDSENWEEHGSKEGDCIADFWTYIVEFLLGLH